MKRKYETPDIAAIQLTTDNSLLAGSVVVVTKVPITIEQEVSLEDYQNGIEPFDSNEFKDLDF